MNFHLSPHFQAVELFSKSMLSVFGTNCTWFVDQRLLVALEFIHSRFGTTYMNNWYWGGNKDSRGFRAPSDPEGASLSQHRFSRAADCMFKNITTQEVREDIKINWKQLYLPLGITTIESDVSHLHFDLRYIPDQKELFIVKPPGIRVPPVF